MQMMMPALGVWVIMALGLGESRDIRQNKRTKCGLLALQNRSMVLEPKGIHNPGLEKYFSFIVSNNENTEETDSQQQVKTFDERIRFNYPFIGALLLAGLY